MAPICPKLALFCLLLAAFCASAAAEAEGEERWVFSSVSGGVIDGLAASVIYGGGQFVAVGRYGAISMSPDGRRWTAQNPGVDADLSSIAWGEEAGYVVLGDSGRVVLTSVDGVSWVKREASIPKSVDFVSYAGGKYFASFFSKDPPYYSVDGVHWGEGTTPSWGWDEMLMGSKNIVYGNGIYLGIMRHYPPMLTSADGVTWDVTYGFGYAHCGALCRFYTQQDDCMIPFPYGLYAMAYGNNLFLAVGSESAFGWSEDGEVWEIPWGRYRKYGSGYVLPDGWEDYYGYDYNNIVYDGTRFVVIRGHEMCFTPDGKSLTPIYSGLPKPLAALASDGKASIVVLSEDGQLGLLSKDTTSSITPAPKPLSPKSTPKFSIRQSGKTLRLTLPRHLRQAPRPDMALYSVSGKKQKISPVFTATGSTASLSIHHIPSGLYVLMVIGEKDRWQGSVVIKR